MGEQLPASPQAPEGLMFMGYMHSADAVRRAVEHFGVRGAPATVYYPASSSDASLLVGLPDMEVIHVDPYLAESEVEGFQAIGAEFYPEDAHEWMPDRDIDVIALFNAGELDKEVVIRQSRLKPNGLVVAGGWGWAADLRSMEDLELVSVVDIDEEKGATLLTDDLDDYFDPKTSYSELDEHELRLHADVFDEIRRNYGVADDVHDSAIYESLFAEHNARIATRVGFRPYPKKRASMAVYRKR